MADVIKNPRVFISYSWDSPEHKAWVMALATQLRQDGIDARLDAWHLGGRQIPSFMTSEVRNADFILAICTPRFREKVHATEDDTNITGSGWEAQIASSIQFNDNRNRMVPVLASGTWREAAPDLLSGLAYFDFSQEELVEKSYQSLLLRLLGKESSAPALGVPPDVEGATSAPLLQRTARKAPGEGESVETTESVGHRRPGWLLWAGVVALLLAASGYFWTVNHRAVDQFEKLSASCQRQAVRWCGTDDTGQGDWLQAQIKPADRPDDEFRDLFYVSDAGEWQPHTTGQPPIISMLPVGPAVIRLRMNRKLPQIWGNRERIIHCEVSRAEEACPPP